MPLKAQILLIDDHALFCEGLCKLAAPEPDLEMAASCGSVEQALEIMARQQIDLVLLDLDLGERRGSEFLVRARAAGYTVPVLILTGGSSEPEIKLLLTHGISGIFLKDSTPQSLFQGIRDALAGQVLAVPRPALSRPGVKKLTEREREVLSGIFEGLTNKEIAGRLCISESLVKAVLQQLFQKTGVRTRSKLVRVALEKYADQI